MEAALDDQTAVGYLAGTEGAEHGQELEASDAAVSFLSSIEPAELQKCVFADSLVTVSEGGRDLGEFNAAVEFAHRGQPCMMLHAQSQGAIDDCPCGTTVTGERKQRLQRQTDHYYFLLTCIKESISYPRSVLRGLVTEGSSLLLMRLMALRKKVPENMTFVSLDQGLHIIHTSFVSNTHTHTHTHTDTHKTVDFKKIPLVWEEDMQMRSKFLDRKEELKADHSSYLRKHPEIRALVSDFLQLLLLRKPDDVFLFTRQYFTSFVSPPRPSQPAKHVTQFP
uniref:Ciliogenesis-associated TTC17-interacting protein n=1 Tax=Amphilophus citrinellus TaxID=61819 RepID=A0A3Q0RKC3_AMPCI